MNNIRYGIYNIRKNFLNAKELKASFLISIVGMSLNNVAFIILWYYFSKVVGEINGWKAIDIFGLYGLSSISYGIVNTFFYGIYNIPRYIKSASMDKYLLTPKNILLKVSVSDISTSAIGDILFGIVCFAIFIYVSKFGIIEVLVGILLCIISAIVMYAFSLICMSISFYLMDGSAISEGLYWSFITVSLYHGGAFNGILKLIFSLIIPSLLVGVIPVELINNIDIVKLFLIFGLAIIWLLVAIIFFYKSLKKYESNSLFGFGN